MLPPSGSRRQRALREPDGLCTRLALRLWSTPRRGISSGSFEPKRTRFESDRSAELHGGGFPARPHSRVVRLEDEDLTADGRRWTRMGTESGNPGNSSALICVHLRFHSGPLPTGHHEIESGDWSSLVAKDYFQKPLSNVAGTSRCTTLYGTRT